MAPTLHVLLRDRPEPYLLQKGTVSPACHQPLGVHMSGAECHCPQPPDSLFPSASGAAEGLSLLVLSACTWGAHPDTESLLPLIKALSPLPKLPLCPDPLQIRLLATPPAVPSPGQGGAWGQGLRELCCSPLAVISSLPTF